MIFVHPFSFVSYPVYVSFLHPLSFLAPSYAQSSSPLQAYMPMDLLLSVIHLILKIRPLLSKHLRHLLLFLDRQSLAKGYSLT